MQHHPRHAGERRASTSSLPHGKTWMAGQAWTSPAMTGVGSIAADEEAPAAVRADAEAEEIVGAGVEHVLVVAAGDDLEQLDLLLRREGLERRAGEIRPHVHFLGRARIDVHAGGLQD